MFKVSFSDVGANQCISLYNLDNGKIDIIMHGSL